jgi:hypothetical protein
MMRNQFERVYLGGRGVDGLVALVRGHSDPDDAVVAEALGLTLGQVGFARAVLTRRGNDGSASGWSPDPLKHEVSDSEVLDVVRAVLADLPAAQSETVLDLPEEQVRPLRELEGRLPDVVGPLLDPRTFEIDAILYHLFAGQSGKRTAERLGLGEVAGAAHIDGAVQLLGAAFGSPRSPDVGERVPAPPELVEAEDVSSKGAAGESPASEGDEERTWVEGEIAAIRAEIKEIKLLRATSKDAAAHERMPDPARLEAMPVRFLRVDPDRRGSDRSGASRRHQAVDPSAQPDGSGGAELR